MENVTYVKTRQAVIGLNSEAWDTRSAIAVDVAGGAVLRTAAIEQIVSIAECLGEGVGEKEIQTVGELLLDFGLESMIVATAFSRGVTRIAPEVRKRHAGIALKPETWTCPRSCRPILCAGIGGGGKDRAYGVGSIGKDFQVTSQGVHIGYLDGHGRRNLILHG